MLRSTIARKIVRARSTRMLARGVWGETRQTPPHLPLLSEAMLFDSDPIDFPLYRPALPYMDSHSEPGLEYEINPDQLPSDADLKRAVKSQLTQKAIEDVPEIDERTIREFYTALVEAGNEEALKLPMIGAPEGRLRLGDGERKEILARLELRLSDMNTEVARGVIEMGVEETGTSRSAGRTDQHRWITSVLAAIASSAPSSAGNLFSVKGKEKAFVGPSDLSLGIVSRSEWQALFEESLMQRDARGAEAVAQIMLRHGVPTPVEYLDEVTKCDAGNGNSREVARLSANMLASGLPLETKHHEMYLLSLLRSATPTPQSAITYLRDFERRGQPLPQSAYNVVFSSLLTPTERYQPTSHNRALAWDLFTHMRLLAHPQPSREVYRTMIKACGDSRDPQPERARDLWIEMTTGCDNVVPERDEYDAIIRALSSTKKDYLEAFDLLRQMLDRHQDATFVPFEDQPRQSWSSFVPTVATFTALLEGTQRAGDLDRARWILSEVVRLVQSSEKLNVGGMVGPTEELLAGVFLTYASWKLTVQKKDIKLKGMTMAAGTETPLQEKPDSVNMDDSLEVDVLGSLASEQSITDADNISEMDADSSQPRSSADAIREATAIFERILHDYAARSTDDSITYLSHPFKDVNFRTRLINTYLSVHLAHASSLQAAKDVWDRTWASLPRGSTVPNGWSYLVVLDRCAAGTRGGMTREDREVAFKWGREIWLEYQKWAQTPTTVNHSHSASTGTGLVVADDIPQTADSWTKRNRWLLGLGDRQIERCWRNIIRIHTLSGDTNTAVSLFQQFYTTYPPTAIKHTYNPLPKDDLEIRMSTVTTTPEADVPPHLIFKDVDVLHQRLVHEEKWEEVGQLKALISHYERALELRRKWRVKGYLTGGVKPRKIKRVKGEGRIGDGAAFERITGRAEEGEEGQTGTLGGDVVERPFEQAEQLLARG